MPTECVFVRPIGEVSIPHWRTHSRPGELAVPVQPVRAREDGLLPRVALVREDDADARADGVALDERRVADPHARDVRDGVLLARRKRPDPDSEVSRARLRHGGSLDSSTWRCFGIRTPSRSSPWTAGRLVVVRQTGPEQTAERSSSPRGGIEEGETPEGCAVRELVEECGLTAGSWRKVGSFWAAPDYSTEYVHAFEATELTDVGIGEARGGRRPRHGADAAQGRDRGALRRELPGGARPLAPGLTRGLSGRREPRYHFAVSAPPYPPFAGAAHLRDVR